MRLQNNIYKTGLYCRLSREDGSDGPSMSIENQKQLLIEYVAGRGWEVYDIYVDDGLTGTNFDRPDFKRMKQDIECGRIDCVITKDLSRLGRNFVQTGYYTDEYFPEHGVRFIAINDGIDTDNDNNDMAGFYHVMNEFYPKQVSRKIKQVKKAAVKQGKHIGGQAPYGYMKSPEDRHRLVVDAEAAAIVRRIFSDFAAGESARSIADRLTRDQIDSPRFYRCRVTGKLPPYGAKNVWISGTLSQLMSNQVYLGNMVQGKRQVISFKTKRRKSVPKEDWVTVENTHEPIIEKALWDRVQGMKGSSGHSSRRLQNTGEPSTFSGLLRCSDCGANLAFSRIRHSNGTVTGRYRCQGYMSKGKAVCSSHNFKEDMLIQIVQNDISRYTSLTEKERIHVASSLLEIRGKEERETSGQLQKRQGEVNARLNAVSAAFKKLYEDRVSGLLPEDMFRDMMQSYTLEKTELEERRDEIVSVLENQRDTEQDISEWLAVVKKHEQLHALDRSTAMELIESVEVKESFDEEGKRNLGFTIHYRFIGNPAGQSESDTLSGVAHSLLVS